jgi:hypothetical protein
MRARFRSFLFQLGVLFRRPEYGAKVFCIGYFKTGTSSCGKAFELLGYRNASFNPRVWRNWYKSGNFQKVLDYTARFDSFDDVPWLKEDMIPLLDKTFKGSKFVYLERDEDSWKKSLYNWTFKQTGKYPDLERGLQQYRNHRNFVFDYFKDRPEDLLVLRVADDDAFMKLAAFLGKEVPFRKMPHENKT